MKALIQRVSMAQVQVAGEQVARIDQGILLLLGVEPEDSQKQVQQLLNKTLGYRIFPDAAGKMNLSLEQIGGQLLIVSQFTLVADTAKGLRPSFSSAAPPALGEQLYNDFVDQARLRLPKVATGRFGADMQVQLINDGPATFLLNA